MSKELLCILSLVGMLAIAPAPLLAAEIQTPLTDEELTLRPGDTITWSPSSPHRLRFGGKVRNNTVTLTTFDDVKKVLDISPINPDFEVVGDFVRAGGAQKVTATVKPNAHQQNVSEFFFTCGVNNTHASEMVTVSFKIGPPSTAPAQQRNVEIITTNDAPLHRFLLKTVGGEKSLTRP